MLPSKDCGKVRENKEGERDRSTTDFLETRDKGRMCVVLDADTSDD